MSPQSIFSESISDKLLSLNTFQCLCLFGQCPEALHFCVEAMTLYIGLVQ